MNSEEIEEFLVDHGLSIDDIKLDSLDRQFVEIKDEDGITNKFYL